MNTSVYMGHGVPVFQQRDLLFNDRLCKVENILPQCSHFRVDGRIAGTCDGYDAVKQAVEIILNVERYRWQIYQPASGMQWDELVGQDAGYVAAELQRRLQDALLTDDRITGLKNYEYSIDGQNLTVSFTVETVYGDVKTGTEVKF